MKKFKLAELLNLHIAPGDRKLNRGIEEFIACVLSEYAIGYLNFDATDNAVYPAINKYFVAGEITTKSLIDKLCVQDEIARLYDEFPAVDGKGKFDYARWNHFMNEAEWEATETENIFFFADHSYAIPRKFLTVTDDFYVQRYSLESDGHVYFKNIGDGGKKQVITDPYQFSGITVGETDTAKGVAEIEITKEEFFEQSETIKSADAEQRDAITSDIDKNLVILAGAGSGKTRTLVCRLAYLHLVKKVPLNRILLLTFTTSAANEMRKRSLELIEPIYSKFRPLEKPNINARTIDSFVIHLLDTYYAHMGFTIKPIKCLDGSEDTRREKLQMLEETILENKMQGIFKYYFDEKTGRANSNLNWLLNNLLFYACGLPINCAGFDTLLQLYLNKQREANKVMGFTEASLFVRDAIAQPDSPLREIVASRYSCILIDEFQDVNVLQNGIFEPFYHDERVHFTFVGDDDQSIYYWRGSDNSIIKTLLAKPDVRASYLLTNYRNNPNIVEAGNAVLQTIKDRAKKDMPIRPNRQSGAKIRVATYDNRYTNLVNEIDRLLKSGQSAEEICVLSRNREDGRQIAHALHAANIPVAKAKVDVDISDDYKLMKAILNVLSENHITASIREIIRITKTHDVTERHVQKVVLGQCEEFECEDSLKKIKELGDELRQSGIKTLDEAVYHYSLKAAELFENVVNDRHSNEVFEAFENFCKNNNALWPVPQGQLKELFATFEDDTRKENRQGGPLSNGVKISTIHAAKGLEYNVVIITGLSEGQYPSTAQIDKVYTARNAQLMTLSGSRDNYYQLKNTISPLLLSRMVEECDNPAFSRKEHEQMVKFKAELSQIQEGLLSLSADGVEEYLDSYRYYILPLEIQYQNDINEQKNAYLVEKTTYEQLSDEIMLLTQENQRAAKIQQRKREEVEVHLQELDKKIRKVQDKELRFSKSIAKLKEYYNICLNASGLLADMEKADEIEQLRTELEVEKEQRINEERRLYYVAITRARDFLYLCHAEGTVPSEFICIISDELKTDHVMLTQEEERECQRLAAALHEATAKSKVDDEKVQEHTEKLLSQSKFKTYIRKRTDEFGQIHQAFNHLCPEARPYYEKAIGLLFVAELTGGEFKTEFAHNMQRVAEITLQKYAGSGARPFKTTDFGLTQQIVSDIRDLARRNSRYIPAPKYLQKLISENTTYGDELCTLKSAGIMHYIVRSGKYTIERSIKVSWENREKLERPSDFLIATLELANVRNALIHGGRVEKWPEDPIPVITRNAEILVEACKFVAEKNVDSQVTPTANLDLVLTEDHIKPGNRVKHVLLGEGTIVDVLPKTFSVDFDNSTRKAFLLSSAQKFFTAI